jgi:VanZ family protein
LSTPRDTINFRIFAHWSILILYAGVIFVLSSMSLVVRTPHHLYLDKIVHALEFGIFSILLYRAMAVSFIRTPAVYLILITSLASIAYGAIDEYHQFFTPLRIADIFDLIADTVGILIAQGIILARVYFKR